MLALATIIGATSYVVFFFGVFGMLSHNYLIGIAVCGFLALFSAAYITRRKFMAAISLPEDFTERVILLLLMLQSGVSLIGALAPELSFDALWYHLTLPKMYLEMGKIGFIPGSLFSYSVMPKLTEMLYVLALGLGNMQWAKLIHFSFGVLCLMSTYALARKFLSRKFALFSVLLFSSNLVFAWQMTTAYVDLARTWFELLAFSALLYAIEKKSVSLKWLVMSAGMLGLAVASKLNALFSIPIFVLVFILHTKKIHLRQLSIFVISFLIPLPWFLLAWITTGNPFYPVFSQNVHLVWPQIYRLPTDILLLFTRLSDPISPAYFMLLPLLYVQRKIIMNKAKLLAAYVGMGICIWLITPRDGGGRFFLPHLPVLSILLMLAVEQTKRGSLRKIALIFIVLTAIISILYRAAATQKYLPVVFGRQTQETFLMQHLNFSFGDVYDEHGEIKRIVGNEVPLIFGGHNLYYADFAFVHETQRESGKYFKYILTIDTRLPAEFSHAQLLYENQTTKIKLFFNPADKH